MPVVSVNIICLFIINEIIINNNSSLFEFSLYLKHLNGFTLINVNIISFNSPESFQYIYLGKRGNLFDMVSFERMSTFNLLIGSMFLFIFWSFFLNVHQKVYLDLMVFLVQHYYFYLYYVPSFVFGFLLLCYDQYSNNHFLHNPFSKQSMV